MIIRTPERDRFVVIAKKALEDERLSWKARGLLAYLLTKPDNWHVYSKQVVNAGPDGRDAVLAGFRELERFGYMQRTSKRSGEGTYDGMDVEVYETAPTDAENPSPVGSATDAENPSPVRVTDAEKPEAEKPEAENLHLVNTDLKGPMTQQRMKKPPNPHGKTVGGRSRRGMRGSGTSPRELRDAEQRHLADTQREAELERLVTAIPTKYADHPDIAEEKIRMAFAEDPGRLARSLAELDSLTASA